MVTSALPLKLTEPATSPLKVIVLAVANVVAVLAFPVNGPLNEVAVNTPPLFQLGPPVDNFAGVTARLFILPVVIASGLIVIASVTGLVPLNVGGETIDTASPDTLNARGVVKLSAVEITIADDVSKTVALVAGSVNRILLLPFSKAAFKVELLPKPNLPRIVADSAVTGVFTAEGPKLIGVVGIVLFC
jgi:hypothetical protein